MGPAMALPGSAVQRCRAALAAAGERPDIFWALDGERALADGAAVDAGRVSGPLAGVPVAVKDSFAMAGLPTRVGLPEPLEVPDTDAWAVSRLRSAGALAIGKTAMDQLAFTMTGTAPGYPPLDNPAAPGFACGGSSGGSAAAVAAGIVPVALGSDTGGSIRVPAAWCGVVGVKPTFGRIPLDGVAPLAPSFDTAGVLGHTTEDCITALGVLGIEAGTSSPDSVACAVLGDGVPEWFAPVVDELIAGTGWRIVARPAQLPRVRVGRLLAAELAASWPDVPGASRDIADSLERGRAMEAADLARDRDALAALRASAVDTLLDGGRVLLAPTVPGPVPEDPDALTVAFASRFTMAFNALHWPSASLPCGLVDGRPVGLQIAAAPGDDAFLLACLRRAEAVLDPRSHRA